jgi:hypothetical protein
VAAFPVLKTGAVAQYPADREIRRACVVHEFVDGSEQRFVESGAAARRWVIRLQQLEEEELFAVERFFAEQGGAAGSFRFTDPWTQTEYPDCSFEQDEVELAFAAVGDGRTEVTVRENR